MLQLRSLCTYVNQSNVKSPKRLVYRKELKRKKSACTDPEDGQVTVDVSVVPVFLDLRRKRPSILCKGHL